MNRYYFKFNGINDYFTPREFDIVSCLLKYRDIADVAKNKCLTKYAIEFHIKRIKQKLGCKNQFQLALALKEIVEGE